MRLLHLKMRSNASLVHLYSAGIILILTSVLTSHEQQSSMQKSNETGILMGLTPDGFIFHTPASQKISPGPHVLDCWNVPASSTTAKMESLHGATSISHTFLMCGHYPIHNPSSNLYNVSYNRNSVHHRHIVCLICFTRLFAIKQNLFYHGAFFFFLNQGQSGNPAFSCPVRFS